LPVVAKNEPKKERKRHVDDDQRDSEPELEGEGKEVRVKVVKEEQD
jgi:hypothetical protein